MDFAWRMTLGTVHVWRTTLAVALCGLVGWLNSAYTTPPLWMEMNLPPSTHLSLKETSWALIRSSCRMLRISMSIVNGSVREWYGE